MGGTCSTTRHSRQRLGAGKQNAKKMENPTVILQRGLDSIKKAVDEDMNHNFEEALRCYVQGVMVLLHVAKYNTESQQAEDRIKEKCAEYIARIQKIKDYLNDIYGAGIIFDELEMLSDSNVLNIATEIICMCGDFMDLKQTKN